MAVAPDLPGHGSNISAAQDITLQAYVDCVIAAVDKFSEPVIVVGHSMSGAVISEVANQKPEKVRMLIYLAAYMPLSGKSTMEVTQPDDESIGSVATEVHGEEGIMTVREEKAKDFLYGDCAEDDAAWAIARLVPEPLAPAMTPVGSGAAFEGVRRMYIECLQDKAIGPLAQKRMHSDVHCERVLSMHTSHSPFLAAPKELADNLDYLARL